MKNDGEFYTVRGYELLRHDKKLLTSSMEDYLEMIYRNSFEDGYIRINTLADLLNVQASSATKMVQKLTQLGLLKYEKYGIIFLTESGKEIGKFLLDRHNAIEKFLGFLGVSENILLETELIEHNISPETYKKINRLNSFLEKNPELIKRFEKYIDD